MNISNLNKLLTLLFGIADKKSPCKPMISFPEQKPPFPSEQSVERIKRSSPEQVGLDACRLVYLVKQLYQDTSINAENLIVCKDDRVCLETSFHLSDIHHWKNTFSECKTITGIAIGMLYDQGLIRMDEKLSDIFPDMLSPLQRFGIGQVTVHQLLTMQSLATFNEAESMTADEWVKAFLSGGTRGIPGSAFQYNSLNSFMLSAVLQRKTGCTLMEYLNERLFSPMGIRTVYWEKSPDGIQKGGWGLYIIPEDLLKIGLMMLHNGTYNGHRYLSEEWISQMGRVQVIPPQNISTNGYGYHMWVSQDENEWYFNGMYGQNMIIYRKENIVIVCNASNSDMFQNNPIFELCRNVFLLHDPRYSDREKLSSVLKTVHQDPFIHRPLSFVSRYNSWRLLKQIISHAFVPFEGSEDASIGLMPRMMQSVENRYTAGLSKISFEKQGTSFFMLWHEGNEIHWVPLSFDKDITYRDTFGQTEYLLTSRFRIGKDEDHRIVLIGQVDFCETPFKRHFRLYLNSDGAEFKLGEKPGRDFLVSLASSLGPDLTAIPIIGKTFSKFNPDMLYSILDSVFNPILMMSLHDD